MPRDIKALADALAIYLAELLAPVARRLLALEQRAGLPGPAGERGERGDKGLDGAPGPQGERGPAGERGERGEKGLDGAPGPQGERGPAGERGERGEKGLDGAPGRDADPAEIVRRLLENEMFLRAVKGDRGDPGRDGRDGAPGTPGPRGDDGAAGRDGLDGKDGRDGITVSALDLVVEGRTLQVTLRCADGREVVSSTRLRGHQLDAGVWRSGHTYEHGDGVTYAGSYWYAQRDTSATPGKSPDWRLAVKRGRDGRNGSAEDDDPTTS